LELARIDEECGIEGEDGKLENITPVRKMGKEDSKIRTDSP
jgi:hypothetical protein